MPRKESAYPADWMRIAEKDLARVGRLLDGHDQRWQAFACSKRLKNFSKLSCFQKGGNFDAFTILALCWMMH